MTQSFNVSPYFDDFSGEKNFHKVLFQPSRPVQTRELNQLQSILQDQVAKFGNHMFKNGAMIIPGHVHYDNKVTYVKLNSTYNNVASDIVVPNLLGKTISNNAGVKALVVHYEQSTDTDNPVIFVKYTSGSNNATTFEFEIEDVLTVVGESGLQVSVLDDENYTGSASIVTINDGVYFVNGYFVQVSKQTITVDKYSTTGSWNVVLNVVESVVTEVEDESLYDNALGYPNYGAPGANRYKISLVLDKREYDETSTNSESVINILQIKEGIIVFELKKTLYAEVEKIFARRTYDESGDYEVNPAAVTVSEYRSNNRGNWAESTPYIIGDVVLSNGSYWRATSNGVSGSIAPDVATDYKIIDGDITWVNVKTPAPFNTGIFEVTDETLEQQLADDNIFVYRVGPGKAYVKGFEVERQNRTNLIVDKATQFERKTSESLNNQIGTIVEVTDVLGIPNIDENELVEIRGNKFSAFPTISATATITSSGGVITNVTITNKGYGYPVNSPVTLNIPAALTDGATVTTPAVFRVVVSKTSEIESVKIINGGAGYNNETSSPTTFTGILSEPEVIGTCRVKSMDFISTGRFRLNIFDLNMNPGYKWDIHSDYLKSASFSANIVRNTFRLAGSGSITSGQTTLGGVGTAFINSVQPGQVIVVGTTKFVVSDVGYSNNSLSVIHPAGANINNAPIYAEMSNIRTNSPYLLTTPQRNVRSVRSSDDFTWTTSFRTKRKITVNTNGSGVATVQLSLAGETFDDPLRSGAYIASAGSASAAVEAGSMVVRSNENKTLTFTGAENTTYEIVATIVKNGLAAKEKVKTIDVATVTFTGNQILQSVLSLGKADVFNIISIKLDDVDWIDNYVLDKNITEYAYKTSLIRRKTSSPLPAAVSPGTTLTVVFEYFKHSRGDYFTINSYPQLKWSDVPVLERDSFDFRPRVGDDGTYTGIGSSNSELLAYDTNISFDYSYYLPRQDIIILDENGEVNFINGTSAFNVPKPNKDVGSMELANAIVFPGPTIANSNTVRITKTDNKRYTMKDIGSLENRINNLEYYTELSLLEKDTIEQTVLDSNGLDRFKAGILVDQFKNLGAVDVSHPDHLVKIDADENLMTAFSSQRVLDLTELDTTNVQRAEHNYQLTGNMITLPYTEHVVLNQAVASRTESVNPFDVVTYNGSMEIFPNVDNWFERSVIPASMSTVDLFDEFSNTLREAGALGSVSTTRSSSTREFGSVDWWNRRQLETTTTTTNTTTTTTVAVPTANVVNLGEVSVGSVPVPWMRANAVVYNVDGLKPNTQFKAQFNELNVSIYPSVDIVIDTTANTNLLFDGKIRVSTMSQQEADLRRPFNTILDETDTLPAEIPEFDFGSLVYFRNGYDIWFHSAVVIDIINISATRKLLKCVYMDAYTVELNNFAAGKVGLPLYTNTANQNIATNTSGDIRIGTVVSITVSPKRTGTIVTDSLGKAVGYFVIPCWTNGTKVPTGDAEFRILEG